MFSVDEAVEIATFLVDKKR